MNKEGSSGKRSRDEELPEISETVEAVEHAVVADAAEGRKKKKRKSKRPVEEITSDLFIMDATPSAVPASKSYIEASMTSPTKPTVGANAVVLEILEVEKVEQKENGAEVKTAEEVEAEEMRIFAAEVAMDSDESDDDDDDDDDEDDDEEVIFDDPKTLQQAIQGKITDDSAAKVTGRYYKEVDLTRSCSLCGGELLSSYALLILSFPFQNSLLTLVPSLLLRRARTYISRVYTLSVSQLPPVLGRIDAATDRFSLCSSAVDASLAESSTAITKRVIVRYL